MWGERSHTWEHLIHGASCGRKRCTGWKAPHSSRCRCREAKARLRWLPSQKKLPVVTQLFLHLNHCSQFVCKTRALKKKRHLEPARREMEARNALVPRDAGHTVGASSSGGFQGSSRTARALSLPLTLPVIELQWCRKESGSDALLLCQSPREHLGTSPSPLQARMPRRRRVLLLLLPPQPFARVPSVAAASSWLLASPQQPVTHPRKQPGGCLQITGLLAQNEQVPGLALHVHAA